MKDAFGKEIAVGDTVIYSIRCGSGTVYKIAEVIECWIKKAVTLPDRVRLRIIKSNGIVENKVDPIVHTSTVVVLPVEYESKLEVSPLDWKEAACSIGD